MYRFAAIIFLSAFLLFQVQPIIAKYILPWFGGTASVWTVCLLFFQVVLLLGYSYTHLLNRFFNARQQIITHCVLVGLALLLLPITPDASLQPIDGSQPTADILKLLIVTIGIPYALISASGPLFQRLFEHKFSGHNTYRLYALSNIGSLGGLLSYPFLFEPNLTLNNQSLFWSGGFVLYFILCLVCYWAFKDERNAVSSSVASNATSVSINWSDRILWILLAGIATMLLLSSTNQICLDIASVPFLWIVPLSLYLLTFIISFDKPVWYQRKIWIPLFVLCVFVGLYCLLRKSNTGILFQIVTYSSILFTGCMICHGELARSKPHPSQLTEFYLLISLGGALGGIFVALIAPLVFSDYWELHLSWILTLFVAGIFIFRSVQFKTRQQGIFAKTGWASLCAAVAILLGGHVYIKNFDHIFKQRSFYGVLKVVDSPLASDIIGQDNSVERSIYHGTIVHGSQLRINNSSQFRPTSYYSPQSGIAAALNQHPATQNQSLRFAVVGMGSAAVSPLCKGCGSVDFYELDPHVIQVANDYFTYLDELKQRNIATDIHGGDARIALEKQLKQNGSKKFDVLMVDAFSGDAIPVHLLTIEAMRLYWQHLRPDGTLVIHISNRHIDLRPVIYNAAEALDKTVISVIREKDDLYHASKWMLMTNNPDYSFSDEFDVYQYERGKKLNIALWTDDYSNLFDILY